ncbi:MAG: metallophosphoesterase [Patescibacteria group bacterium]
MTTLKNPLIAVFSVVIILAGLLAYDRLSTNNLTNDHSNDPNSSAQQKVEFDNATHQILAVGDIGNCQSTNDDQVADLAKTFDGKILTLGDTVYKDGTVKEFSQCFNPSWQTLKSRIYPSPGNHDYHTQDATGYFNYFGAIAAPDTGYYAIEYGGWLLMSLNSNCQDVDCGANSAQVTWLKDQLSATSTTCQLAFFHHPRFSSGAVHGNNQDIDSIWRALVDGGVDIALAGHEHLYERFGKLNVDGQPSMAGVREFIVGTGGKSHYRFAKIQPGSEFRDNQHFGLLKISLGESTYGWEFIATGSNKIIDFGNDSCR